MITPADFDVKSAKVARAVRSFLDWAGTAPFKTLTRRIFSFGIPAGLAVLGSLVWSRTVSLGLMFGVLYILFFAREMYWASQQKKIAALNTAIQAHVLDKSMLARTISEIAEHLSQEWWYKELRVTYWLDKSGHCGKFEREMIIDFPENPTYLLACVGRIRIGAQGKGTRLCSVKELDPRLICTQTGVFSLLLPLKVNAETVAENQRWHIFTILIYAPAKPPQRQVHLRLTANWPDLWMPLARDGIDHGTLELEPAAKKCELLSIEILTPEGSGKNDYSLELTMPTGLMETDKSFDNSSDRYKLTMSAKNASPGLYTYTIRRKRENAGEQTLN